MVSLARACRVGAVAALGVSFMVGCNAILGIETATVDPTLLDSGAGDADAGNAFTCKAYCATLAKNCTGIQQEYTSNDVCEAMCSHFEPGRPGEQTNDSLACRVFHANEAAKDPNLHCSQAGPMGAGTCSSQPCSAYCSLTFTLCNPLGLFPYDGGEPGCRTACAGFPYLIAGDAGDASGPVGDIVFASGDTLNCRLYHLESAYEVGNPQAPITHCPHTAVQSATCN
jgi:hypothetical protein